MRAAAHQRDGLVAGALEPVQHHDLNERAGVKRRRGRVEADIADRLALQRQRIEALEIGH